MSRGSSFGTFFTGGVLQRNFLFNKARCSELNRVWSSINSAMNLRLKGRMLWFNRAHTGLLPKRNCRIPLTLCLKTLEGARKIIEAGKTRLACELEFDRNVDLRGNGHAIDARWFELPFLDCI